MRACLCTCARVCVCESVGVYMCVCAHVCVFVYVPHSEDQNMHLISKVRTLLGKLGHLVHPHNFKKLFVVL